MRLVEWWSAVAGRQNEIGRDAGDSTESCVNLTEEPTNVIDRTPIDNHLHTHANNHHMTPSILIVRVPVPIPMKGVKLDMSASVANWAVPNCRWQQGAPHYQPLNAIEPCSSAFQSRQPIGYSGGHVT